jgi:hypothetical protein
MFLFILGRELTEPNENFVAGKYGSTGVHLVSLSLGVRL